jgi:ATP-dependent phosphoenolpyruvate carboxykinase
MFMDPTKLKELHDILLRDTGIDQKNIYRNAPVAVLYEDALRHEQGTFITSTGALVTSSGAKTGRCPSDKRIVEEETSQGDVWWGPVNIKMTEHVFSINRERAVDYINIRPRVYVVDAFAGWDPKHRLKVRIICCRAYHGKPASEEPVRGGASLLPSVDLLPLP